MKYKKTDEYGPLLDIVMFPILVSFCTVLVISNIVLQFLVSEFLIIMLIFFVPLNCKYLGDFCTDKYQPKGINGYKGVRKAVRLFPTKKCF